MVRRKTSSRNVDDAVARSVNFELTIADIAKRSERRAWWVAFTAIAMALILAGGYFYMLPLKEKVPYIVMADAYTGTSTVARLTDDITNRRISSSEAINRSNVAHFVMARETYDLAMLNMHDWATVQTMSSPGVKAAYANLYSSMSSDSLYQTYGKDRAIRVKLLSIVLVGGDSGATPKGATIRFQRSVYDKQNGITRPMDSKIATMAFTYNTNLGMDDQNRIENPLGFWVTDYRVDNDYASSAPDEIPSAAIPAANTQRPQLPGNAAASDSSSTMLPSAYAMPQAPSVIIGSAGSVPVPSSATAKKKSTNGAAHP